MTQTILIAIIIGSALALVALMFLGQQFFSGVLRSAWHTNMMVENIHIKNLASELEVVYQELSHKNRRLVELSGKLQQKNDALKRHAEFQSRLFAMVSHDLRNAVTSVFASLQLLYSQKSSSLSAEEQRFIEIAYQSSRHVKYLSESMTEYISLKRENLKVKKIPVQASTIFEQILPRFSFEAEKSGLTFSYDIAPDLPMFQGDPGKLTQVFSNLIHNALKFTPSGGNVHVQIGLVRGGLEVSVKDTGLGIAAHEQDKIFEEFYCSSETKKFKQKGWGLGLAIVRQVMQLHGGAVRVMSEGLGKGSTFTCRFPVGVAAEIAEEASV